MGESLNSYHHTELPCLLYGRCCILLCLVHPVYERTLADFQTEHLLEEVLYTAIGQEHHHAQVDDQRLDAGIIHHGIQSTLTWSMRLDALTALLADCDVMTDFLHNRLQFGNRHHLSYIVQVVAK